MALLFCQKPASFYTCDNYYNKSSEGGIAYNDPSLNIDWVIPKSDIILSEKDSHNPTIDNADFNFIYNP